MNEKSVMLYTLTTCSHCKSVKKLLNDRAIAYDFIDVDLLQGEERKETLAEVKKVNPKCSFPTIVIGEKVIVGFKEKLIREALEL